MESVSDDGDKDSGGAATVVRRPMNAFLIFCKRHRSLVREKNPHLDNRSVTRILGELWASLPADEKVTYTDLAKQYKDAFMKANPDYKWYNPEKAVASGSAANKVSTIVQPGARHTILANVGQSTEGFTLGKLADPSNMGGLSLLLMAGTSIDDKPSPTSQQSPTTLTDSSAKTSSASSLLQLAEMCSTRLDEPQDQSTSEVVGYVAMTPPWTPKHDMTSSQALSPTQEAIFDEWNQKLTDSTKPSSSAAAKPTNQILLPSSSTPKFISKAALKSPPAAYIHQQHATQNQFTEIRSQQKVTKLIPKTTPQRLEKAPKIGYQSKPDSLTGIRLEPVVQPSVPASTSKAPTITMDNFIESMFCHEMAATEKHLPSTVSGANTPIQVQALTPVSAGPLSTGMTFGQIQEQLIRKAMESSYTSPSKIQAESNLFSVRTENATKGISKNVVPKEEGKLMDIKTPFLFPFFSGLQTPTKTEPGSEIKPNSNESESKDTNCKKEDDLTCHEEMDQSSPITREEIEKKLMSSAEKIQAALSSDLPKTTPRKQPQDNTSSKHSTSQPLLLSTSAPQKRVKDNSNKLGVDTSNKLNYNAKVPAGKRKRNPKVKLEDDSVKSALDNASAVIDSVARGEEKCDITNNNQGESVNSNVNGRILEDPKMWKRHDSTKTEDNSDSDSERRLWGEAGDVAEGLRKSHRRNRGKRYQQLVSQGLIHSNRHKRTESQSEDPDKDFTPSPGSLLPQTLNPRKRKRTVSETSATCLDEVKYKTGDFDLEEKIARLRPCTIESPSIPVPAPHLAKKTKRSPRHRHHSTSATMQSGNRQITQQKISVENDKALNPASMNIAELLRVSLSKADNPQGSGACSKGGAVTMVTGSARRKVRKHAITRLVPLAVDSVGESSNNNSSNDNGTKNSAMGTFSNKSGKENAAALDMNSNPQTLPIATGSATLESIVSSNNKSTPSVTGSSSSSSSSIMSAVTKQAAATFVKLAVDSHEKSVRDSSAISVSS